jgi:3',5'-cyclic-AMP phosphodiesterase
VINNNIIVKPVENVTFTGFRFKYLFMDRKKFIQNSSLLALGSTLLPSIASAEKEESSSSSLDVVFISDVHVKPTDIAQEGMRKAFRLANKMKPDFIINGGDAIMDAMAADKEKTTEQWNVWKKILNEENRLPIFHAIGNHDAWGWQLKDESVKSDPLYDKGWVIQEHNMAYRYYSYEKRNWKFIVLDTAHENNGGYIAKIDEQQFAWLETELKNTSPDKHVCVVSHIPIVSFCSALFFDQNEPNGDWKISRALLLTDARKMIDLFSGYQNIRCCLSGHIHLQDEVQYKNVQYFCNGATSGNWWNGAFKGFEPAFARFTFFKDGNVKRQMINYGQS